jgi:Zn-dependent protease
MLPVLLGITMHDAAHGWVARKLGDNTAYEKGRVSFNPFRHIDLFGTIILPALLVVCRSPFNSGWVMPVPVHFQKLRHLRRDMVIVAAAGPFANLVLAVGSGILVHVTAFFSGGGGNMAKADVKEQDIRPCLFVSFQYVADPTARRWSRCGRPVAEIASPSLGAPGAL